MAKKPTTTPFTTDASSRTIETEAPARAESKKTWVIDMLRQPEGSTIAEISTALGWQPHTTRAAITGLRKAGHKVETAKPEDGGFGLIYRIALSASADVTANNSAEASQ